MSLQHHLALGKGCIRGLDGPEDRDHYRHPNLVWSALRVANVWTMLISRSTYGFCHGDPGEIGQSRMPIAVTRDLKARPYARSLSRAR
jgi:hypothetical protein